MAKVSIKGPTVLGGGTPLSNVLADGKIFVGNSSNIATGVTPSGDVTVSNTGVFTVVPGAVDHGDLTGLGDDDHLQYHTDARALTWLGTRSTTDLPEGTNLYFTDERGQDSVGTILLDTNSIDLSYNDGTPSISADLRLSADPPSAGFLLVTNTIHLDGLHSEIAEIDLTSDVTGVLPIANGGTNNAGPFTSGSIIYSNGTILTQNNAHFYFDPASFYVGLGTNTPDEKLVVQGNIKTSSLTSGGIVVSDSFGVLSNVGGVVPISLGGTGTSGPFGARSVPIVTSFGSSFSDDPGIFTYHAGTKTLTAGANLKLFDDALTNSFTLGTPASITSNYSWTVPAADANGVIVSNGSGILSIENPLSVAHGGTGAGSLTASRLVATDGSSNLTTNAALTSGGVVISDGTGSVTTDAELTYNTTTNALSLKGSLLQLGSTSGTLIHAVPSTVTSYTLTYPSAVSAADDVMLFNSSATGSFGKIANANVSTSAAIAFSKLAALTGSRLVNTSAGGVIQVNSALTSGRVPYANGTGSLTDSSNMTFSGIDLSIGGSILSGATIQATQNIEGAKVLASSPGNNSDIAIGFSGDKDAGFYQIMADNWGMSMAGIQIANFQNDNIEITTTNGLILPAGSAANPSLTGTGGTDNGLFFPTTASVGISTGGTLRTTTDSSGFKVATLTASRLVNTDSSGYLGSNAALTTNRIPFASAAGALTDNANINVVSTTSGDELVRLGTAATGGIPAFTGLNIAVWGHQALHATLGFALAQDSSSTTYLNSSAATPSVAILANFGTTTPICTFQTNSVQVADSTSTTVPTLCWFNDTNTGFNRAAADDVVAIVGGSSIMRMNSTGVLVGASTAPVGSFNVFQNGVEAFWLTGTVNTTNNSQTVLITFTTATDITYHLEGDIIARRTGGSAGAAGDSASYKVFAFAKNVAGTLTLTAVTTVGIVEDQAAWDATFTASGTAIRISVTGATNNNVTWDGLWKIMRV